MMVAGKVLNICRYIRIFNIILEQKNIQTGNGYLEDTTIVTSIKMENFISKKIIRLDYIIVTYKGQQFSWHINTNLSFWGDIKNNACNTIKVRFLRRF